MTLKSILGYIQLVVDYLLNHNITIVMTGLILPHCSQIIPSDLPIITNGENTVNKKYIESPTSGNQLVPWRIWWHPLLPSLPRASREQIPSIGSNYALSTLPPDLSSFITQLLTFTSLCHWWTLAISICQVASVGHWFDVIVMLLNCRWYLSEIELFGDETGRLSR